MRTYKNLQLLDITNAKLIAISAYRKDFGVGVLESKQLIENILKEGLISFVGNVENLEIFIKEHFSYNLEIVDEQVGSEIPHQQIEEPDVETQKALEWYALRLPFEREYIEKIIAWEKRRMIYPAFG